MVIAGSGQVYDGDQWVADVDYEIEIHLDVSGIRSASGHIIRQKGALVFRSTPWTLRFDEQWSVRFLTTGLTGEVLNRYEILTTGAFEMSAE